jgi:tetratricopeptide (TPR) repeat protein
MEQHSKQVLQFGRDPHDLGQIQRLHIEFLLSSKRFDEAIDFGLKALHILGQEFLPEPDWAFTTAKLSKFLEHLEQRPPDYVSIPRLYDQDPELLSISDILFSLGSAAYIYRPAMAPLMYMRSLELSLERQLLSDHTPTLVIGIGMFANALLGKVELAHAYGEVAMELASRAAFQIDLNAVLHAQASEGDPGVIRPSGSERPRLWQQRIRLLCKAWLVQTRSLRFDRPGSSRGKLPQASYFSRRHPKRYCGPVD